MRLALINPNTSAETTALMVKIAAEEAGADAEVTGYTAASGAPLITTPDALDAAAEVVAALAPDLVPADAVIVAGFGDPGVAALRAVLSVPVTGIAEASMGEAAAGGRRFAVATTTPDLRDRIAATAALYGFGGFVGTWTTPGDPAALTADAPALEAALAEAVAAALREGGAEAVVIGGGPLALAARALSPTAPVSLIEPVPAAVRLSRARIAGGILA
ncbi:MAG: aspartate/glutamate racemase family protein [Pseudomonadota bacterium]